MNNTKDLSKIVIIGDANTGKSSFLRRLEHKPFTQVINPTIGCDFTIYKYKSTQTSSIHKFIFWDTSGQTIFNAFAKNFTNGAKAVLIFFDVSSCESFNNIYNHIDRIPDVDTVLIIVPSKCDKHCEYSHYGNINVPNRTIYMANPISSKDNINIQYLMEMLYIIVDEYQTHTDTHIDLDTDETICPCM